ncbi:hypothetical protein [Streptomyces sp. NPDC059788]|uniref:hypothetical protein n=1 Tax=Streptomyces sp. NPDC059788 TaxID=3346948 RepID=UPI0036533C8D
MTDQPTRPVRTVLKRFPAAGPYGSWPVDQYTAHKQAQGQPARGVMDLHADEFLVIADSPAPH